jgi:thiamine pyrophosphate-dependent acetolactate synthase large subunit-like protein
MVIRYACLRRLASIAHDVLVVTHLKGTANEWCHLSRTDGSLYYVGMGHVSPVALGLAMALPHRRVLALDGDGSLLFNLNVFPTMAVARARNLTVICFDNECYESNGGIPTATASVADLTGIATASGVNARTVTTIDEFDEHVTAALTTPGPHFVNVKVEKGTVKVPITMLYGKYNKYTFVKHIEQLEGKTILTSIKARGKAYTPNPDYFVQPDEPVSRR